MPWSPSPGSRQASDLKRLKIPTLVIAGDYDTMAPSAVHIAGAIPGTNLVRISDCGHFAVLECPREMRKAIDTFFGRPD